MRGRNFIRATSSCYWAQSPQTNYGARPLKRRHTNIYVKETGKRPTLGVNGRPPVIDDRFRLREIVTCDLRDTLSVSRKFACIAIIAYNDFVSISRYLWLA